MTCPAHQDHPSCSSRAAGEADTCHRDHDRRQGGPDSTAVPSDQQGGGDAAEIVLFGLLTDVSSVEKLLEAGFTADLIPTADLRPVYEWAIRQYKESGENYAPTPLMFESTDAPGHKKSLAGVLKDYDIDIHETPYETPEWAIEPATC